MHVSTVWCFSNVSLNLHHLLTESGMGGGESWKHGHGWESAITNGIIITMENINLYCIQFTPPTALISLIRNTNFYLMVLHMNIHARVSFIKGLMCEWSDHLLIEGVGLEKMLERTVKLISRVGFEEIVYYSEENMLNCRLRSRSQTTYLEITVWSNGRIGIDFAGKWHRERNNG